VSIAAISKIDQGECMRIIQTNPANRLLAELDPEDFDPIGSQLRSVTLQRGAILQEQGSFVDTVYFPLNSIVSMVTTMLSGSTAETVMIGREGAVGMFPALGRRRAFARAIVQTPGAALSMPAAQIQEAALCSEPFKQLILRYKEYLMAQVIQTAACNALHSVEARLARRMLQMNDRAEGAPITETHVMMSQMLGARRTTVTLLAGKFQDHGIIRYRRGRISIIDRRRLEACACECYGIMRGQSHDMYGKLECLATMNAPPAPVHIQHRTTDERPRAT